MAKRRLTPMRDGVPFLRESELEAEAQLLLDEYAQAHTWQLSAPVPVDDIIELHLKLAFRFEDLQALFQVPDLFGAIWFKQREISVDVRLDPTSNPRLLGRYRFTVGHETGHWRLHRPYYQEDPNQGELFDGRGRPAFICRSSLKPPVEWQADFFAGCLLIPREVVRSEWQEWRGNLDPVAAPPLTAVMVSNDPKENDSAALERFCRPFAARFEVSPEAMRIRLENLGFLLREVPNTLF